MAITDPRNDVTEPSAAVVVDGGAVEIAPPDLQQMSVPGRHERGPVLSHLSLKMVLLKAGVVLADVLTIVVAYTVTTIVVGSGAA